MSTSLIQHRSTLFSSAVSIDAEKLGEAQSLLKEEVSQFNWVKQWYAIQLLANLDPKRPTSIQLLGKDLVVWRDGEGVWRCFEDKCPHRLVPLSEGRLETDGTLQCAYHGWRFNGKGECTKIPQAEPEIEEKLCSNLRACAVVHPTYEQYGLLWVWGDSGPNAILESLVNPPSLPSQLEVLSKTPKFWGCFEVPYNLETFVENVVDPAHAQYAHHGILGNRNKPRSTNMKLHGKSTPNEGFLIDTTPPLEGRPESELHSFISFDPPGLVWYNVKIAEGNLTVGFLVTPKNPSECRIFQLQGQIDTQGNLKKTFLYKIPRWTHHLLQNLLLQQDNIFLNKQQELLQQEAISKPVTSSFYMPTSADVGVAELHRWLAKMAGGGPSYAPGSTARMLTYEEMTDTYNSHTRACKYCMGALNNFRKIQVCAWIGCAVCTAMTITYAVIKPMQAVQLFNVSFSVPALKVWLSGLASVIGALIGVACQKIIERFYKTEFAHADS